ncbi:hypothetical protein P3T76_009612 [Phytophthora citrophthora]|uniref:Uncharacterized protein n=1 Tax=Phytophthora citrophthora TaxID=4793 RepID=A0AAD9GGB0_9STRA|nr:hypothetical protein P3T76_009612 [Phytophthora citrophthora]
MMMTKNVRKECYYYGYVSFRGQDLVGHTAVLEFQHHMPNVIVQDYGEPGWAACYVATKAQLLNRTFIELTHEIPGKQPYRM